MKENESFWWENQYLNEFDILLAGAFDKIVIASVQDPLDTAVGVEITIV